VFGLHPSSNGVRSCSFKKVKKRREQRKGKDDTSRKSGEKLTHEEIDTFLKANNGGHLMNEDSPYVWVGKHVTATYYKWPRQAWHDPAALCLKSLPL